LKRLKIHHHTYQTTSKHHIIGTTQNSYTPHRKTNLSYNYVIGNKREIKARVVFDKRQNHDPNSTINPNLNKEVTVWLFVRSMSKTPTVAHGWTRQVKDFLFDIYNWVREDEQRK